MQACETTRMNGHHNRRDSYKQDPFSAPLGTGASISMCDEGVDRIIHERTGDAVPARVPSDSGTGEGRRRWRGKHMNDTNRSVVFFEADTTHGNVQRSSTTPEES